MQSLSDQTGLPPSTEYETHSEKHHYDIDTGYFLYGVGGLLVISAIVLAVRIEQVWGVWIGLLLMAAGFVIAHWAETFVVP
jgi:hypothetical protein